jgi:hypothetical protein
MKKAAGWVSGVLVFCAVVFIGSLCFAQSAFDQLQGMSNTGETFDGSDGMRFGMDTDVTYGDYQIPEPVAEPVETYDYQQEDYSSQDDSGYYQDTSDSYYDNSYEETYDDAEEEVRSGSYDAD